jgi:hypothetical protein
MKITHTIENGIPTTTYEIPSFREPKHRHRHNDPSDWDLGVIGTGHFKCRSHRKKVFEKKLRYMMNLSNK